MQVFACCINLIMSARLLYIRYIQMKTVLAFIVIFIFEVFKPVYSQEKVTVSGYIRDKMTGEELIGASVLVKETGTGVASNLYGFYSVTLISGEYTFIFSYVSHKNVERHIVLSNSNTILNVEMEEHSVGLNELVIYGEDAAAHVEDVSMSKVEMNMEQIREMPSLFGESDIIKAIQMQPGVISAGEGTSGYFVRGGSADQNLILIDEAPVYDPSHLFGLFSVFNSDVIKDAELYKGGIPAQYGGRLSSLLDVRIKDGNNKRFSTSGGIGTLASRLLIEGPIKKDKSSFLISGRRSYMDVFQRMSKDPDMNTNLVYFYDFNAKVNWKSTNKNRFFASAYYGRDNYTLGDNAAFDWGNATFTFRWNHLFSDKLFANTSAIFSRFSYGLELKDPVQALNWTANMDEGRFKMDFDYFLNPQNHLIFGYHGSYKRFFPGVVEPRSDESFIKTVELDEMYAMEHNIFVGNEQKLSDRLMLQYGVRFTLFQNIGPASIRVYDDPMENINIQYHIEEYDDFEIIKSFPALEPRFSARYLINAGSSIKLSYNRMVQNVHLMSNSTVPVPFNTWQPSSPYLDPQIADQIAGGYFKNLNDNTIKFSAEVYYKWMKRISEFADNANIFFNPDLATEFRPGSVRAYGFELFLQKTAGRLNGTVAYTFSKAIVDNQYLNGGKPFPANYDRRHNLTVNAFFDLSEKWSFGGSWLYSSGRPITIPAGRYEYDGYNIDYITSRNGYLLPSVHRLDLSAILSPHKNRQRRWQSSWVFAVYNVYNRKNPFTIYTRVARDDDGVVIDANQKEAMMVYLFSILPSVTYNFSF